jgi:hypothetical protein
MARRAGGHKLLEQHRCWNSTAVGTAVEQLMAISCSTGPLDPASSPLRSWPGVSGDRAERRATAHAQSASRRALPKGSVRSLHIICSISLPELCLPQSPLAPPFVCAVSSDLSVSWAEGNDFTPTARALCARWVGGAVCYLMVITAQYSETT